MADGTITAFGGSGIPDQTAQFLARVLAWSTADPPDSYVNIHAFTPKASPRARERYARKGGGRAYASLTEYAELQQFLFLLNRDEDEAFFCVSTRSAVNGTDKAGHRRASRAKSVNQPVQLKAFVLDLDVKAKGYASQRAALAAVLPFLERLGIKPGPIVDTGGGLHVYITLPEPIRPSVWQRLANALIEAAKQAGIQHDVGVTRDDDRLLRLPGSYNRKLAEPRLCRILDLGTDTTLADLEKALAPYRVAAPRANGHSNGALLDPTLFPPRRPITGSEAERVQAEVEQFRVVTSAELLVRACPVVADSLERGGDDDVEPLWFELAKLCHYVEDGRALFHRLSHKYSGQGGDYSPEDTDAKYDTVQTGGWPHCQTIADSSPEAMAICQTCPHWAAKRTPIHATQNGSAHKNGSTLPPAAFAAVGAPDFTDIRPSWLPGHWAYDPDGLVSIAGQPVFTRPVHDVRMTYLPDSTAVVEFQFSRGTRDLNDVGKFTIPTQAMHNNGKFHETIMAHGLGLERLTSKDNQTMGTDLLTQIQLARAAVTQQRTGWLGKEFAYGGQLYTAEGPRPSGSTPISLLTPRGNLADWKAAAAALMGRNCIEMEIIMATGYTGPLVAMSGVPGTLLHVFGETGRGKTLACTVACSVACDPQAVIKDQTQMAGPQRITTFNNIPVYFDEFVRDDSRETKGFAQLVKNATSGSSRLRLDRSGREREVETSRNQVVGCANRRLTEVSKLSTTNAQAARIVEFEMSNAIQQSGLAQADFISVGKALQHNHGVAMQVYIDFVVRNYDAVNSMVQDMLRWLNNRLQSGHSERFWIAQLAIIFVAVRLASKLGLQQFNISAIQKFLLDWYIAHRDSVFGSVVDTDNPEYQLSLLNMFYNDNLDKKLTTSYLARRGRHVERAKEEGDVRLNPITLRPRELAIRIASKDAKMLISVDKLRRWCESRSGSFEQLKVCLTRANYCTYERKNKSIGGGTHYPTVSEPVLMFDLNDPRNAGFLPEED